MRSINPANGQINDNYTEHTLAQCNEIIDQVYHAWDDWKKQSFEHKAALMQKLADVLEERKHELGILITREMGKIIGEAEAEVEKSAWVCRYYAENAATFLQDEIIQSDASRSLVAFEPLGPVLAVMPWNFPFWQVFRFAAPALMAGNAAVLKHASNVPGCALAIEALFVMAGFPQNIFRTCLIGGKEVHHLIQNDKIKAATLTGSESAGRKVAEQCGKQLKKMVLELGGSDAYVVLADADLDKCVETAVKARMINAGQSCIAAKRFIVVREVYEAFVEKATRLMKSLKAGDPENEDTDFGPLARPDIREDLDAQIQKSIAAGAKLICGGKSIEGAGYYYEATLVTDVKPGMTLFDEETFGPVMAVIEAKDENDALNLANQSAYGLGGSIWTKDIKRGEVLARRIESGAVFVNAMTKSDPRLPFGGIKNSGYGRELSHYGIREFVNIKTIAIDK